MDLQDGSCELVVGDSSGMESSSQSRSVADISPEQLLMLDGNMIGAAGSPKKNTIDNSCYIYRNFTYLRIVLTNIRGIANAKRIYFLNKYLPEVALIDCALTSRSQRLKTQENKVMIHQRHGMQQ